MFHFIRFVGKHWSKILLFSLYYTLELKILLAPRPEKMECGNPYLGESMVVIFFFIFFGVWLTLDLIRSSASLKMATVLVLVLLLPLVLYFIVN